MKIAVAVLVLLLLVGGSWFLYRSMNMPLSCNAVVPAPTIGAFGDSLVAGYGAHIGEDAISILSEKIGVPITNFGVSGNTSADALVRIDTVLATDPDIVIVLLGGNDALQGIPVSITEQNLSLILERLKEKDIHPLLVGVIGGFPTDPYAAMFERLSKEYAVPLVPNILSGLIGREEFMSDAIHPNSAGHVRIADKLVPYLERLCLSS